MSEDNNDFIAYTDVSTPKERNSQYSKQFSSAASISELNQNGDIPLDNEYQWNEKFQVLLGNTFHDEQREFERIQQLSKLCEDFGRVSCLVGKRIIAELFEPVQKKTIPPATFKVGGIAGGEKYLSHSIFFKLAVDEFGIYGGEEGMMKSEALELKGAMSIMDARVKGIHVPLMATCDYRGWRLLCSSVLPIAGNSTLVHGSGDGGKTIVNSSPEFAAKAGLLAKILNLKGEFVWNNRHTNKAFLCLSSDIEGHVGKDNRFYLVDTARLFPPSLPRGVQKGEFLQCLLRPELVKSNPIPLCADSYSGFGLENKTQHNAEVKQATERLFDEIIPSFANKLEQIHQKSQPTLSCQYLEDLLIVMHRQGINCRYLGRLRSCIRTTELKKFILTEILARVIKHNIRYQMRELRSSRERDYANVVVEYFNVVFGCSEESDQFWENELLLPVLMEQRFESALTEEEFSQRKKVKSLVDPYIMFLRLKGNLGIRCSKNTLEKFEGNPDLLNKVATPFVVGDVEELVPLVKYCHRISFEEATAYSRMAVATGSEEMFQLAQTKFRQAVFLNPSDYRSLSNWGLALYMHGVHIRDSILRTHNPLPPLVLEQVSKLVTLACQKFEEALSVNPSDHGTFNKWGNCFVLLAQIQPSSSTTLLETAIQKFEQAHKIKAGDYDTLFNWGNALFSLWKAKKGNSGEILARAIEKYEMAYHSKRDYQVVVNMAVAVAKQARLQKTEDSADLLFQRAQTLFQTAIPLKENNHEVYFNLANMLYQQARTKIKFQGTVTWRIKDIMYSATHQYFHALKLKPDFFAALNNWTRVLAHLASVESLSSPTLAQNAKNFLSILRILSAIDLSKSMMPLGFHSLLSFAKSTQVSEHLILALNRVAYNGPKSETNVHGFLLHLAQLLNVPPQQCNANTMEAFDLLSLIAGGRGSFARVFKARMKNSLELCAVKVLRRELIANENKSMQHPFIVALKHVFDEQQRAHFVYEYVGGTLRSYLQRENIAMFYIAELVVALEYLQENKIVYGNLTTKKILLDNDGHIKVAHKIEMKADRGADIQCSEYMAPELLLGADETAVDWWSLGIILFELLTGSTPFKGSNLHQTIEKVLSEEIVFPSSLSDNARSLLCSLLTRDASKRLAFARTIQSHPFFELNWSKLKSKEVEPPLKPQVELPEGMADTIVLPNIVPNFMGFTYASPSLENKQDT